MGEANIGLRIVGDDGSNLDPGREPGESWASYLEWRRSKCRPFDRAGLERMYGPECPRLLEEIDQATHEFVGECAEVGELFLEHQADAFLGQRNKLIDECGDAIFCGCWALDAWGHNPLSDVAPEAGVELIRVDPGHHYLTIAKAFSEYAEEAVADEVFLASVAGILYHDVVRMQSNAGLTANSFKKLRYQRRGQDAGHQCQRIGTAMEYVNAILIMAGSSMAEAMASNRKKLDARFPEGYRPGVGGGIREGDGR